MFRKLLQLKLLIIIVILALLAIIASGYFFAQKKSEPVYLSKIDRLMFDNNNKSPKFVIELPDAVKGNQGTSVVKEKKPEVTTDRPLPGDLSSAPEVPDTKELSIEDILMNIPSVYALPETPPTQTLSNITSQSELTEQQGSLVLPKISADGRKPWTEYGKIVKIQPTFKKVAVVIKGNGFDDVSLDKINKAFASEVSIAFSPYAPNLSSKITPIRQQGHETYVDMLLSSTDFLKSDSGPLSMSLTISPEESQERLNKTLAVANPVGGVVINDGVADESNAEILTKLLIELKNRGLLMIDATSKDGIDNLKIDGLARQKADVVIENLLDKTMIEDELKKAERIALTKGQVLVVVEPKPIIIKAVFEWVNTFSLQPKNYEEARNAEIKKPLALVPVSNLVVE